MKPDQWDEVTRLFGLVMDAEATEREAILERECAGNESLAREVRELLSVDTQSGSAISRVVSEAVKSVAAQPNALGVEVEHACSTALAEAGLALGDVVDDRYRIQRILGAGGMGVVLAARHEQLGSGVALKLLGSAALSTERMRRRFVQEAKAAARIRSPHVVHVRDVGSLPNGCPYLVMDLLEGSDLSEILRESGPIPPADACSIVLQACEGLAAAHAEGVIHRDIKPGNLFVERQRDGRLAIRLLDFGISKVADTDSDAGTLTRSTDVVGSPAYMSPEQLRASREVDPRADIWSVGVVLYEMLSGARPFEASSVADTTLKVLSEEPEPLVGCPDGLAAVVMRCLEKQRDLRYPDVSAFASALAPFAGRTGAKAAERVASALSPKEERSGEASPVLHKLDGWLVSGPVREAPVKHASTRPGLRLAVGGIAAVALAVLGFALFTERAAPAPETSATQQPAASHLTPHSEKPGQLPNHATNEPQAESFDELKLETPTSGPPSAAASSPSSAAAANRKPPPRPTPARSTRSAAPELDPFSTRK